MLGITSCEEKNQYVDDSEGIVGDNLNSLVGTWFSPKGLWGGMEIVFGDDGSIRTELVSAGLYEAHVGVYRVEGTHIHHWLGDSAVLAPDNDKGDLMTYRFQGDNLELTFFYGIEPHVGIFKKCRTRRRSQSMTSP